ncbi:hypothetical protein QA648_36900 (plasmid) [Rhizobium sp. CB3171]|uniref:hypothetical protein n=1 Tax=Rhizobium sp. CB3171 TaxID=3039157 RepID=UPI0024B1B1D6|nr:hypothetical protein [Rhizobium sp. CB3171]WFU07558.1 hypothetical protein QA648_36900 [Rhizobium sp. CB3171]
MSNIITFPNPHHAPAVKDQMIKNALPDISQGLLEVRRMELVRDLMKSVYDEMLVIHSQVSRLKRKNVEPADEEAIRCSSADDGGIPPIAS